MQFIPKGPDIPEKLLLDHEEGRVVFFCGAGISVPAGLPLFKRLVEMLYANLNEEMKSPEKSAFDRGLYDTTIGLLEHNLADCLVRTEISNILQPNYSKRGALSTHASLLTLAKDRNDSVRLVTTNQDRIFEKVITDNCIDMKTCQAPFLPMPKKNWNSLVYLHGLLDANPDKNNLDSLVFSSGDFGLAYLTERWASRFVSELFKNYTICFVGYSIGDPVLRYMMDALAADKAKGESVPTHYAFGDYCDGEFEKIRDEWMAKNVIPILYKSTPSHAYLHRTLKKWAETYRDGLLGKETIVIENALGNPLTCTSDDDFVGRTLWALMDPSGLPAKRFSELDPTPPVGWIEVFIKPIFTKDRLRLFSMVPSLLNDKCDSFSFFDRPTDYTFSPRMAMLCRSKNMTSWDNIMDHMANWVCKHLSEKKLLTWIIKADCQLHPRLAEMIREKLDRDSGLPDTYKAIWRLICLGHAVCHHTHVGPWSWIDALKSNTPLFLLRLWLRQMLSPKIYFYEPFRYGYENSKEEEVKETIKDVIGWKIVLSVEYPREFSRELIAEDKWMKLLPSLTSDLTLLVKDALDLMKELGEANEHFDHSFSHRPSIAKHANNRNSDDWTMLIDWLCDSWKLNAESFPELAKSEIYRWVQIKYPLFRRLVFFAATETDLFEPEVTLSWLLSDNGFWLWSADTKHEIILLIRKISPLLKPKDKYALEYAIMNGPPRTIFREDTTDDEFERYNCYYIWHRLTKYVSSGVRPSLKVSKALAKLTHKYPDLKESTDESDEFVVYSGGGEIKKKIINSPADCEELAQWLLDESDMNPFKERIFESDDWGKRCREDFNIACQALIKSSKLSWVVHRWTKALDVWADSALIAESWKFLSGMLVNMPDEVLKKLMMSFCWWLCSAAKNHVADADTLLALCGRVIRLFENDNYKYPLIDTDPVTAALNHPVGQVTEALIIWWYDQNPQDNLKLPAEIKPVFSKLSNLKITNYLCARINFAQHVIPLLRVDPCWTTEHLIPLFQWGKHDLIESLAVWRAFLWAPRRYDPLLELIKEPFLKTVEYYKELKESSQQYASFLTFIAVDPRNLFTQKQLAQVTQQLPSDGLQEVVYSLMRMVDGAGDQQSDFFENRIKPYFKAIWPKSKRTTTQGISEALAKLCLSCKSNFPEAIELLSVYFKPVENGFSIINPLKTSGLCAEYPEESLNFLGKTVNKNTGLVNHLNECLEEIKKADSSLTRSNIYRRLRGYCP